MPAPRKKVAKKRGKKAARKPARASGALPTSPSVMSQAVHDHIMMFYGPPGVGKTTFVNNMGNVLFISTDRGTRAYKAMRAEVSSWSQVVDVIKKLKAGGAVAYDMVCIDHISDIAAMAEQHVLEKLGVEGLGDAGYGKGWKAYKDMLSAFVRDLLSMDVGVVFIAHEKIQTVRTRAIETERTMPALTKSAWNVIVPLTDIVGYCGFRTVRKNRPGGKKGPPVEVRVLETEPREDLYAKDRTNRNRPTGAHEMLDGAKFITTF